MRRRRWVQSAAPCRRPARDPCALDLLARIEAARTAAVVLTPSTRTCEHRLMAPASKPAVNRPPRRKIAGWRSPRDPAAQSAKKIAFIIPRRGHVRGRPVARACGGGPAINSRSASVSLVWRRFETGAGRARAAGVRAAIFEWSATQPSASRHDKAAVDIDRLACDVCGVLAGEERNQTRDVVARPRSRHRNAAHPLRHEFAGLVIA